MFRAQTIARFSVFQLTTLEVGMEKIQWRIIFPDKGVHPWKLTRWWFQIFFIFNPTWGNDPIRLINIFEMG